MSEKRIKLGIILYRVLSRAYFHLPFLTIYFYFLHYNIRTISLLMAVYGGAIYLYNLLPEKNKITYHFDSRKVLLISEILKIFGLLFLLIGNHILILILGQFLSGLSFGVAAGSDSKILYTNIKEIGFQEKSNSYMFLSCLISGLIGSVLFSKNIKLPFLFSIMATIVTIVICITLLPEDSNCVNAKKVQTKKKNLSTEEKKVVYTYAFTRGLILSFFTGFLPYYLNTELRLPAYSFIILLSSYSIAGNLSAMLLGKIQRKGVESRKSILWLNGSIAVSILFFFFHNLYGAVLGCLFLGTAAGISRPICMAKIKENENYNYLVGKMEKTYAIVNFFILIMGGTLYKYYAINGVLVFLLGIWVGYMIVVNRSSIKRSFCSLKIKRIKIS